MAIKNVEDRMGEMDINGNHDPKDNYVYVQTQDKGMDNTVNVDMTLHWEKELLADPKV